LAEFLERFGRLPEFNDKKRSRKLLKPQGSAPKTLTIRTESDAIEALRTVLRRLPRRPDVWKRASENSDHIGAILAEAVLQAGLNYDTVVAPRVQRFLKRYPSASTVSAVLSLIDSESCEHILNVRNRNKGHTFVALTRLLCEQGVETGKDLREWLEREDSRSKLLSVKGVAIKTAAFLRLLAGLEGIAIDVHLHRAAADAKVEGADQELERLHTLAAAAEGISLAEVDGSLWLQGSERSRETARSMVTVAWEAAFQMALSW
jgi:endonuclease III